MHISSKKGVILQEKDSKNIFLYSFPKDMAAKEKVKFLRGFFGYKSLKNDKEYPYQGFLEKLQGEKFAKNLFLVPDKHSAKVKKYLKSKGVDYVVK